MKKSQSFLLTITLLVLVPLTYGYTTSELSVYVNPPEQTVVIDYNTYNYIVNEQNSESCPSWESVNVTCIKLYTIALPRDEPLNVNVEYPPSSRNLPLITPEGLCLTPRLSWSFDLIGHDVVWHDLGIGSSVSIILNKNKEEFRPVADWSAKMTVSKSNVSMDLSKSDYTIMHLNTSLNSYETKLRIASQKIVTPQKILWIKLGGSFFPFDRYKTNFSFSSPVGIDQVRMKFNVPQELTIIDTKIISTDYNPKLKFKTKNLMEYYPTNLNKDSIINVEMIYGRIMGFWLNFFLVVLILIIPLFSIFYTIRVCKIYKDNRMTVKNIDFDYFSFIFFVFAIRSFLPYPSYTNFTLFDLVAYSSIIVATISYFFKLFHK